MQWQWWLAGSRTLWDCLTLQVRRTTTGCDPSATLRPTSSLSVSLSYRLPLLRTSERSGCRRFHTTARGRPSYWSGLRWIWETTATLWRNWPRTNSEPCPVRAGRNWPVTSRPSNMWSVQLLHRYMEENNVILLQWGTGLSHWKSSKSKKKKMPVFNTDNLPEKQADPRKTSRVSHVFNEWCNTDLKRRQVWIWLTWHSRGQWLIDHIALHNVEINKKCFNSRSFFVNDLVLNEKSEYIINITKHFTDLKRKCCRVNGTINYNSSTVFQ